MWTRVLFLLVAPPRTAQEPPPVRGIVDSKLGALLAVLSSAGSTN
jgi:hypothetical protein